MRWQYLFNKEDPDFKIKEEKLKRIRNFWIAFEKLCLPIWDSRHEQVGGLDNFASWVQKQLNLVDEKLLWEVHEIDDKNFYFAVTAGNDETKQMLAEAVIDSAPEFEGWQFLKYLPAHEMDELFHYCKDFVGFEVPHDLKVSCADTGWNRIDLTFFSKQFSENIESIDKCIRIGKYALGEELFERWVDRVMMSKPPSSPSKFFNKVIGKSGPQTFELSQLKAECERMKQLYLAGLPEKFVSDLVTLDDSEELSNWTVARDTEDESHPGRKERLFYSMKIQLVLFAVMNALYFHSQCHSKLGEVFCYIKSMPFDYDSEYAQAKRTEFHFALDGELRKEGAGCVLGIGSGLSSIFVDLVLRDVERALPILLSVVRKYALPEGTWLLFYDSHLCDEWVGLTPHAKSPF